MHKHGVGKKSDATQHPMVHRMAPPPLQQGIIQPQRWCSGKEPACQSRRHRRCKFDCWAGKIPWRRERLPTPVSWTGEFHGLYSSWGHKESDMIDWLTLSQSGTVEKKWSRSVMSDSATPWTVAYQAPPSKGFSRQEYWSGVPFPSPGLSNLHFHKVVQWKRTRLPMQETQEMRVGSLGQEDPLEGEMAIHPNNLAWEIPWAWTEEPGRLQSTGSQRVRRDWAHTCARTHTEEVNRAQL